MYQELKANFTKIPPFLLRILCGKRNGSQTDVKGDYYRAPASQCRALVIQKESNAL
jgi:hypothetical protein